jgi:tubulin monoglycylase TTLL3/8
LQAVQDQVDNRKNSFEFYGYDFMVDQEFRVWLIEVNSSPSMDRDTPVTGELVPIVLTDLCKVIIDYPAAKNKKDCDTGYFQLIYKSNIEVQRP